MTIRWFRHAWDEVATAAVVVMVVALYPLAQAQEEMPPPQGKGRIVVVASGMSGPEHYRTVSRARSQLGYDVVLFDGNPMEGTHGEALRAAIQQAQPMPHALTGKVALVGFSLGDIGLGYGVHWPDQVAVVIAWYPATSVFHDIPGFASRSQVPVLMFAGEKDAFRNCCPSKRRAVWRQRQASPASHLNSSPIRRPNTISWTGEPFQSTILLRTRSTGRPPSSRNLSAASKIAG